MQSPEFLYGFYVNNSFMIVKYPNTIMFVSNIMVPECSFTYYCLIKKVLFFFNPKIKSSIKKVLSNLINRFLHDSLDTGYERHWLKAKALVILPEISLSPVHMAMLEVSQPGHDGMVRFIAATCMITAAW